MGKPKISICIPAYNNAEEVRRLLDSIFKQTFQDWEIILTDDSTNEEISVLVKETAQDRLHYIFLTGIKPFLRQRDSILRLCSVMTGLQKETVWKKWPLF